MKPGPDRVIETENIWTTQRDGCVKIKSSATNFETKSLVTVVKEKCSEAGDQVAMVTKRDGKTIQWTYKEYFKDIKTSAKAFIKLGLERFHGVAVWGFNSPEWFISDVGAIFAGGLPLGLYPTNSIEINKFILNDSCTQIIVVEDSKNVQKIIDVRNELPHLKKIVQYSGTPVPHNDVLSWENFMKLGENESEDELEARHRDMAVNECATLVYTSGTTGTPKGVMLSHDNIYWCAMSAMKVSQMRINCEVLISYLPLSHVAANLMDIWVAMCGKATIHFADKMALKGTLLNTLKEVRPTIFLGVPRVWEKIMEGMLDKGKSVKGLKRNIANSCKKAGLNYHLKGKEGLMYIVGKKLVYKTVKEALGLERCRLFYSGAAPIADETLKYFLSLDITILELYGMSETSGPHTMSHFGSRYKIGSVGKLHEGHEIRIENQSNKGEGEISMWGRNVMMGYLNREDTIGSELMTDGWLKSGDIGMMDQEGFLFITGRLKELIITAGGENIAPCPVEEAVKQELPCISNAILIGDKKKFLSMFLTFKVVIDDVTDWPTSQLSKQSIEWCQSVGSDAQTVEDILNRPDSQVLAAIQQGIDRANARSVSNAARVQRWSILPIDVSTVNGELGPTLKLKRHVFCKKYEDAIEKLYV